MNLLKPCPFCGENAYIEADEGFHKLENYEYGVYCTSCSAGTGIYHSESDAIAAWNLRV
jgi:Lar family restriction alleviation protein